jgi:prepilin-type N-terminal cleavage/methylation domain-containing protein
MTALISIRRRDHGFSLLEVLMALALFATAAVALVETINEIGNITLLSRTLRTVDQGIESVLDEYSKMPQMQELEEDIKAGADGISYRVVVKSLDNIKNQENQVLGGLFGIKVTAKWLNDGQPMENSAETVRYAGMFLPQ